MRVPTNWLKDYMSHNISTTQMAEALEAGGIEVDQIIYAPKIDEQIIVAEIKKVMQHPGADRLKLAVVDTGSGEISVVCGAPNLKVGMKAPFAQVGAKLPDGTKIKAAQIRGENSQGMLASPAELGISSDHTGLMVLPDDAKLGTTVAKLVDPGDVIDVSTQANRFDLLSFVGLAREITAQTEVKLKLPPDSGPLSPGSDLKVAIEADKACSRYMLAKLSIDQSHGTAPVARQRLEAAGLRSISIAVDITNYTMLELGQPLHAFDAHKVQLPITVRFAKSGEALETLDGVKRKLTNQDLVIADKSGAIALAGVMGGASTEVTPETKEILLESATFDAATVRKMAKRHGLRSDASARFERGLVPQLAEAGLKRAIYSYQMATGAKLIGEIADIQIKPSVVHELTVEPEHVSKVLTLEVSAQDLLDRLPRFGFEVKSVGQALSVTVPWWRPDVVLQEDIAEEYIRLVGFDDVEARLPKWQPSSVPRDDYWAKLWQTKATLKGLGLFEVITYSFISKEQVENLGYRVSDHLKLKNPMSNEQAYLRRNLLPSLLASMVRNQMYSNQFGIYETSRVFLPTKPGTQPQEPTQLGVLYKATTDGYQWVKAALDELVGSHGAGINIKPKDYDEFLPGRGADIVASKDMIGRIGELHPKHLGDFKTKANLGYLELDLTAFWSSAEAKKYQPISRFPSVYRDLAVIVPTKVLWQDVTQAITETELAKVGFLNDYYDASIGDGYKSMAMRLEMFSLSGTLTDKEASKRVEQIEATLAKRFGAKTR